MTASRETRAPSPALVVGMAMAAMTLGAGCYERTPMVAPDAARAHEPDGGAGDAGSDAGPIAVPPPPAAPRVLRCDGVDDGVRVDLGDALGDADEVTVELWLRASRILDWTERDQQVVYGLRPAPQGPDFEIATSGFTHGEYRTVFGRVRIADASGAPAGGHGSGWLAPLDTEWHHFALVSIATEPGATLQIFMDGEPKPASVGDPTEHADVHPTEIFLCGALGDLPFEGHVDQLRVSRVRRYHDAFAVPRAPLIDTDTVLILDFDGGEIADRSGHAWPIEVTGAPTLEPGTP